MAKFTHKLSFTAVMALSPTEYQAYQEYLESLKNSQQKAEEYKEYVRTRYGEEEANKL